MQIRICGLGLALMLAISSPGWGAADGNVPPNKYETAFQRLKTLVGEWQEEDEPRRQVTYHLTGNGSALVEEFRGRPTMVSVYHMDGEALRLTHFCNAGNQPRMMASSYNPASDALKFDFVDVTSLSSPTAYHTRKLEVIFQDEDHVQLRFNGRKKGVDVPGEVSLIRRR